MPVQSAAGVMPPMTAGPVLPHPDVAMGGIDSMLLFNEDASLGPEPMLFSMRTGGGFVRKPASTDDPTVRSSCCHHFPA